MSTPLAVRPLYHFTCKDGHRQIGRHNALLRPLSLWRVVWLTELAEPDFEATGLGSVTLKCDRRQYRYMVTDVRDCRRWLGSPERVRTAPEFVRLLEEYGDPEHWWISSEPVPAMWDASWRAPVIAIPSS
jgi:hypothetical protein